MTFYPAPNSYRASTGSMPMPIRSGHSSPPKDDDKHKDKYGSYGSYGSSHDEDPTLKLNTPFSRDHSQSVHSSPTEKRPRRASTSGEHAMVLNRYHNGAILLEPATSYSLRGGERRRRSSISAASVAPSVASTPRSQARRSWQSYAKDIDVKPDEGSVRPGTTRIPRKLVNKAAAEQSGHPFEEERSTGAIIFQRALPKAEIEKLVEVTETLRSRHKEKRNSRSNTPPREEKKKEKHVRIIPHPTEEIPAEEPGQKSYHSSHAHSSSYQSRRYHDTSPRSSALKVTHASDNDADSKSRSKEYRAEPAGKYLSVGRYSSSHADAGEKSGNVSDSGHRERRREYRHSGSRHGAHGREIVIVK